MTEREIDLSVFGPTARFFAAPPRDQAPHNGDGQTAHPPTRKVWSASELLRTSFPDPCWVVPGILPAGLAMLAGRPKIGKSFLAIQLAVAVSVGGMFLGRRVERGRVTYIALEDSPRRMKGRLEAMNAAPGDLSFSFGWAPLNGDGMFALQAEVESGVRLIILDTLSRSVRGRLDWSDVGQVTALLGRLQEVAVAHDTTVLLVDHHRKSNGQSADAVDDVLGSSAKAAVADTVLGVFRKRGQAGATLQATGRDIEEATLNIAWDRATCCWQDATDELPSVQGRIVAALENLGPQTVTGLAVGLGLDHSLISKEAFELEARGRIRRGVKRGSPWELVT